MASKEPLIQDEEPWRDRTVLKDHASPVLVAELLTGLGLLLWLLHLYIDYY